ncbi:hypothetical protein SUGI_0500540 [Cryptomeria japonica]|uniref:AAA-ATPase At4g25835-like n=1 Tax=Cryptomeria japonica TaxID=3369 RepID=UPI002408E7B8|nr:AAA-ATPase At4g25835-like [Cryptomeria japonica]GLJ26098.1 hypothetical protein SUGI_0500540 [Cryptomeria japonica]
MRIFDCVNICCCVSLPEFKGKHGWNMNELYTDAEGYVKTLESASEARNLTAYRGINARELGISPDTEQLIHDSFRGVRMCWTQHTIQKMVDKETVEIQAYTLKMNKLDQNLLKAYSNHVSEKAAEHKLGKRELKLYTNSGVCAIRGQGWNSMPFKHPSTFHTLALDPSIKKTIINDLDRFKAGKDIYRQIGRAWKRGYLLHGPPGTGKSSLIDIYDLELTKVSHNQELRALLTQTSEKAIIVIQDIDCSLDLTDRERKEKATESKLRSQLTLSGLLNFTDGLWSCCGEERIIIFTTNHPEHLDPALLRCGRMGVHIELSYCNFAVFKILAFNYLRIEVHELYPLVEDKIASGAEMTPAEIIEILMSKVDTPDEAMTNVVSALDAKIKKKQDHRQSQSSQTEKEEKCITKEEINPENDAVEDF